MKISPRNMPDRQLDLSVIIPALHEAENLSLLLPNIREVLESLKLNYEIIIIDQNPDQATINLSQQHQTILLDQEDSGYGKAVQLGILQACGAFILTMDADLSHPAPLIRDLWDNRNSAETLIASRYIRGGQYDMPVARTVLSKVVNRLFGRGLDLKVKDMSSGFRLYNSQALKSITILGSNFEIVQEILVKLYCEGWTVKEIPFKYSPRRQGESHARVFKFGIRYLRTFVNLYRLRNSIASADYDARAYDSVVLPQRYWQRQRFKHVTELLKGEGPALDVGCGSSQILGALSGGSIGLDVLMRKLRYSRQYGTCLLQGSGFHLPFPDESFTCVLCSQVIEHVPKDSPILRELIRVLTPGGSLILGTPDYDKLEWNIIEAIYKRVLPSAYADEHISHYSRDEVAGYFMQRGFEIEETRYILNGELILKMRKVPTDAPAV